MKLAFIGLALMTASSPALAWNDATALSYTIYTTQLGRRTTITNDYNHLGKRNPPPKTDTSKRSRSPERPGFSKETNSPSTKAAKIDGCSRKETSTIPRTSPERVRPSGIEPGSSRTTPALQSKPHAPIYLRPPGPPQSPYPSAQSPRSAVVLAKKVMGPPPPRLPLAQRPRPPPAANRDKARSLRALSSEIPPRMDDTSVSPQVSPSIDRQSQASMVGPSTQGSAPILEPGSQSITLGLPVMRQARATALLHGSALTETNNHSSLSSRHGNPIKRHRHASNQEVIDGPVAVRIGAKVTRGGVITATGHHTVSALAKNGPGTESCIECILPHQQPFRFHLGKGSEGHISIQNPHKHEQATISVTQSGPGMMQAAARNSENA